jgi:hypothetical protein
MPEMLRDIVARILAEQPDMEIVGGTEAMGSLRDVGADVVVIGHDDPTLATRLVTDRPCLKVLAVTADGRESCGYELRPQRAQLGEISPQGLVDEIRDWMRSEQRPVSR